MKKFSKFIGGATGVYPIDSIDIVEVIRLFKDDGHIKTIIDNLRKETDKTKQKELKNSLPYITVAGLFSYRNNKSLIDGSYTWACAIDIDQNDNPDIDIDKTIDRMKQHNSVILIAKSPRGNGIKAIIQLAQDGYNVRDQYNIFRDIVYPYFSELWDVKIDNAQGKLSQPFYITHDENLFVNYRPKPLILDMTIVKPEAIINGDVSAEIKDLKQFIIGIIEQRQNKWSYFNKVAMFVGGLCSGNMLKIKPETAVNSLVEAAKQNKYIDDFEVAEKQIRDGFNYGEKYPIDKDLLKAKSNIGKIIFMLERQSITDNKYIRIGDDFYKNIVKVNVAGHNEPYLKFIKRQTLIDDFGTPFLQQIPKYDTFCNVPDYINHQYVINGNYNLFQPFTHKNAQGTWPTIEKLLKHVFKTQYEMGLDYFKLLFTQPIQMLPVICLVSKQNETAKTTLVDFIAIWLKGNVAIISSSDIEGNFNQHFALKHVIAIDESDLHKDKTTSRIKQMATQKTEFRKGKFQEETQVDYFAKLIIISNNERSFINIKDDDIRYWVLKLTKIDRSDFDPDFLKKCTAEIPAFTHFIINRELLHDKPAGRAWFSDADYNTVWLDDAKEENKTALYHDLISRLQTWFEKNSAKSAVFRSMDIKDEFYKTDHNFSVKYISKVLKDEFNLVSVFERNSCTFHNIDNENITGRWFALTAKTLQIAEYDDIANF